MQAGTNRSTLSLALKWLIPIGISGLSIYLLARQINPRDLIGALRSIPILPLLLSIIFNLAGMVLRALAWNRILGKNFDFKTSFFAMSAGYLLNNILPFRLGEFGRAALLTGKDKNKAPFLQVFASIITERTLDIFIAALLFLVTLSLVVSQNSLKLLAYVMLFFTTFILVIGALGAKHQSDVKAWILTRKISTLEKREKLSSRIVGFLEGFKLFLKPKEVLIAFGLLFSSWMMAMVQLWLIQQPLLAQGKFWWTLFVTSAGAFVNALPSAPAGLGVFEAGVVSAYRLIGVHQSVALALALTLHATTFVITSLFGLLGISILGENLRSLFKKANRTKELEAASE
ncbi:MAG TPA: lysylphosphatidylglycerol synthase transmembrane domain-containing protein [Anaerolineaceae bacterium]|nr:lysylphosphatidylglycerol synthase transmembrane domain-containing protein [Anaerolineaceae bacterium]